MSRTRGLETDNERNYIRELCYIRLCCQVLLSIQVFCRSN